MKNNQSPVEWLLGFIEPSLTLEQKHFFSNVIEQAKKMEEENRNQIRTAVANYISSEGCSCCEDSNHDEHQEKLAELFDVPKYEDGSGYNFSLFKDK